MYVRGALGALHARIKRPEWSNMMTPLWLSPIRFLNSVLMHRQGDRRKKPGPGYRSRVASRVIVSHTKQTQRTTGAEVNSRGVKRNAWGVHSVSPEPGCGVSVIIPETVDIVMMTGLMSGGLWH